MKQIIKFIGLASLNMIVVIAACKKDNHPANLSPIADAGVDQVITLPADSVLLDGSGSSDPDGTISEWKWTKVSGPASFAFVNTASSKTVVKNLVAGTYQFELMAKDNGALSAKDTVKVTVDVPGNQPPIACAGADQVITLPTDAAILDGSCSADPDNKITSYVWTKIAGSIANIVNPNGVQTQVTGLAQGTYRFELKVTDAGGLNSVDTVKVTVTNPNACNPGSRPLVPAQLTSITTAPHERDALVGAVGDKLFFIGQSCGSCDGEDAIDIYNLSTNMWTTHALGTPRYNMGVVAAGSKIFFAGGFNTDGLLFQDYYNVVDVYDASTNTWSYAQLSQGRTDIAAAAVGNKVVFAGGFAGTDASNVIDIYDISANKWSTASLSEARGGISSATTNNKIFFAGGYSSSNGTVSRKIDVFDVLANTWSESSLYEPKKLMAGISYDNKLYWAGGFNSSNNFSASSNVEISDAQSNNLSVACLFQPNAVMTAAIKDGKIIFSMGNGAEQNKFDIYDPVTNTWSVGVIDQNIVIARLQAANNSLYLAGYVNGKSPCRLWRLQF
jgi:hypothetical protein